MCSSVCSTSGTGIDSTERTDRYGDDIEHEATDSSDCRFVDATVDTALAAMFAVGRDFGPGSIFRIIETVGDLLGACHARVFVTDYSLRQIQELVQDGHGERLAIEGTVAGRAFASCAIVHAGTDSGVWWVPLSEGSERIGLLELTYDDPNNAPPELLAQVVDLLVLLLVSRRRYTDLWVRTRRAVPLSVAAEAQWNLLPPLTCASSEVEVSGILEPAYEIGGDSFDYALNQTSLDFAIVDAVGHGISAVLMSSAVINCLRNVRRERGDLTSAYRATDKLLADQFGDCFYATGVIGSLNLESGVLTWINAGHMPPMLVRNETFAGELVCRPSMPLGLGGPVVQIATEQLQRGDRLLLYTDGIPESLSPDRQRFGVDRLADFLVRASLDRTSGAETVRRLSDHIVQYVTDGLRDDATLLLIDFLERPTHPDVAPDLDSSIEADSPKPDLP